MDAENYSGCTCLNCFAMGCVARCVHVMWLCFGGDASYLVMIVCMYMYTTGTQRVCTTESVHFAARIVAKRTPSWVAITDIGTAHMAWCIRLYGLVHIFCTFIIVFILHDCTRKRSKHPLVSSYCILFKRLYERTRHRMGIEQANDDLDD